MKNVLFILAHLPIALLLVTCSDETIIRDPDSDVNYPIVMTSDAFRYVLYDGVTRKQATRIGDSLLANNERIMRHLQVSALPQVAISVRAAAHSNDFTAEMKNRIGQVYPGATGYTPSNKDMCLLWNSSTPQAAVHEYAHLVSIALKSNIANNPRWLWEAVAQYESRTNEHPAGSPAEQRTFPGFTVLNQYNSVFPYRWGYSLCFFVLDRWSDDGYISLIKANGDVPSAFEISENEFGTLAGS